MWARVASMADGESSQPSRGLQLLTLLLGGGAGGILAAMLSSYIDLRKLQNDSAQKQLDFASTYLEKVIGQDVDTRVRIAEYFEYILADSAQRDRWSKYLGAVQLKRDAWKKDYIGLLNKSATGQLTVEETIRLDEIEKYFGEARHLHIGPPPAAEKETAPVVSDAGDRLASCAKGQIGVAEDASQSNRGGRVDDYIKAVGGDPESAGPWGAAFVGWCLKSVGLGDALPLSANALELWTNAQAKGFAIPAADLLKKPDLRVGDIWQAVKDRTKSESSRVSPICLRCSGPSRAIPPLRVETASAYLDVVSRLA